ncbi:kelch repeat-containing protein [Pengzhenrongella phosphoraccumulans]|uniref:Kelch repeat-containing protein n=1 Tax=Pengzhenrongella phosphoraccumulans TaxID=3114394 RepID=UPI00388F58AE
MAAAAVAAVPTAPAMLEAAAGDRAVGLMWQPSSSAGVTGYRIYRSTSVPVPVTGSPINASLVTATTYLDSNRTNGVTYSYVVVAVDSTGAVSAPSPVASARPTVPAIPTGATITWAQKASAAIARAEAGGVAYNGELFVFGGQQTGITQTARSDRFNPATDTWTRIRDLPELITHAPVVADGTTLWILGGYVGLNQKDSSPRVWKYDTVTDTYSPGPPLPAARGAGGGVVVGRQLHYFTGAVRMDSTGAKVQDFPDHWVLNLDGGTTWTASTPVPNPRNHVGTVLLNNKVYLIGGQHGEAEAQTPQVEVDAFDVTTSTWTRVADLPVARGHISASCFVWNGKILVVGGSTLGATASKTLYEYDPATNVWTTRTDLPEALRSPVSELIDGRIIVSGGRTATGPSVKAWSGSVAGTGPTPDTTPPGAPTGLTATAAGGPSANLAWSPRTEPDLAGYAVYRSPSTPVPTTGAPLSGATLLTAPSFVDTSVVAGSTYAYVVVARDAAGNTSAAAAPATVTIPSGPVGTGAGVWSADVALPSAMLDGSGAAIGTKVYVVGGKTSAGPVSTLRIYDTVTRTWSTGAPKPGTAVENPALVEAGGFLYAIGGSAAAFTGAVATAYRYDPAANAWTTVASMGTARGGPTAVLFGGSIWVLGGMSGTGASLATTERLNLATGTWSAGPNLGTARDNAGAAALADGIIVFGGRTRLASGTEVTPNLASTEFLPAAGSAWQPRASMITGRRTAAVGVVNGTVVVAGGERQANGATWPQTEAYDPATGAWRSLAAMTTPRHGAAAAVVAGRLHVIGGGTVGGASFSTVHEVFTLTGTPPGPDTTPPAVPVGVTAVAGAGPVVRVAWTAGAEPDLAGYRVYRAASTPVPVSGTPASGAALVTSASWTDPGVVAGSTYHYVVVAADASGNASGPSGAVSVSVPPTSSTGVAVKVRFATSGAAPPVGAVADWGQAYGARTGSGQGSGLSYGWVREGTATPVDLSKNGRLRTGTTTTDALLTGVMHMDWPASSGSSGTAVPGSWELAVPNGSYTVTVSVGDAGNFYNSVYQISVEDQNALANQVLSGEDRFRQATVTVLVSDGRLTVSQAGGENTKINYVDVASVLTGPRVAAVTPVNLTTGAATDLSVTAGLAVTAGGIDATTLTRSTARLTVASDGSSVPAGVNTSGGGDVIVLTPDAPLTTGTTYRFDVTSGVRDVAGNAFQPWSSVFTVGTANGGTGIPGVAFAQTTTPATGFMFTSLTMGPDGFLYAATLDGYLLRYPVAADGSLGAGVRIDTVRTHAGGARTIIGLAFDPASTAASPILWLTENRQYVGTADVPNWTSKIVRLSGPNLANAEDVVVGLPRSARDHETNSLAFKDGLLYITQGSNSAMGAPDLAWGMREEGLLSAAVLRLDPSKLPATLPLDVKTAEGGTYDPFAPSAALTLYATGVRNAYDLVWHSNGKLYVPTNGSARGGNIPAAPTTPPAQCARRSDGPWTGPANPGVTNNPVDETDWVFRVAQGGYYGHPNAARCEWVFNGGNPTAAADPFETTAYPVGVAPDRNYRAADVFDAGLHASANGVVEYRGTAFGGALTGKLVVVRYSASQDLMVLDPGGVDGMIVSRTLGVTGFKGFNQPLDIAQHVPSGNLYVTELGAQRITRLVPLVP